MARNLTPGVARFYARCLSDGVARVDGTVACGSQKELAFRLGVSQGTIASHLTSLGDLVIQRSPVVILEGDADPTATATATAEVGLAPPATQPLSAGAALRSLLATIAAVPPELLDIHAHLASAYSKLVAAALAGRDDPAMPSRSIAEQETVKKDKTGLESVRSLLDQSDLSVSPAPTCRDEPPRAATVATWSMEDLDGWMSEIGIAAVRAGMLTASHPAPGTRERLARGLQTFTVSQVEAAVGRLLEQLRSPNRKIRNPWGVFVAAVEHRDPSYFPPAPPPAEASPADADPGRAVDAPQAIQQPEAVAELDEDYDSARAEVLAWAADPSSTDLLADLDRRIVAGYEQIPSAAFRAQLLAQFAADPTPARAVELARRHGDESRAAALST